MGISLEMKLVINLTVSTGDDEMNPSAAEVYDIISGHTMCPVQTHKYVFYKNQKTPFSHICSSIVPTQK